jgi:hypothetical protein
MIANGAAFWEGRRNPQRQLEVLLKIPIGKRDRTQRPGPRQQVFLPSRGTVGEAVIFFEAMLQEAAS